MTPEKCRLCGSKFTGMFKVERPCPETERNLLVCGVDASDLCIVCCTKEAEQAEMQRKLAIDHLKCRITLLDSEIMSLVENSIPIFTTPHPYEWNAEIKGVATGYSVLGTGIFSEIASDITDMFGAESQVFVSKLREGERRAISSAKVQAIKIGANAISGLSISITEATSASGMLMVSCAGTAIFYEQLEQSANPRLDECRTEIERLQAEIAGLSSPKVIIATSSERYCELANK